MTTAYTPEHLQKWTLPRNYIGEIWPNYYVGLSRHRDSDALTRSNFRVFLDRLKKASPEGFNETYQIVSENHWAVGWVEWIAIHEDDTDALREADAMRESLEGYPVLDENDWSQEEDQEAQEVWKSCYRPAERIKWIREHEQQCEFRSFSDLLGAVRGNYFPGYAGELLS